MALRVMRVSPQCDPCACGGACRSMPSTLAPRLASCMAVALPIAPSPITIASYLMEIGARPCRTPIIHCGYISSTITLTAPPSSVASTVAHASASIRICSSDVAGYAFIVVTPSHGASVPRMSVGIRGRIGHQRGAARGERHFRVRFAVGTRELAHEPGAGAGFLARQRRGLLDRDVGGLVRDRDELSVADGVDVGMGERGEREREREDIEAFQHGHLLRLGCRLRSIRPVSRTLRDRPPQVL